MKIRQKLSLSLAGQVFLIALVSFSFYYQNHKLRQVNQYTVDRVTQIRDMNNFLLSSKDFINDKASFAELSEKMSLLSNKNFGPAVSEILEKMVTALEKINSLKTENTALENQEIQDKEHLLQRANKITENLGELSLLASEMNTLYSEMDKNLSDASIHSINTRLRNVTLSVTGTLLLFLAIFVALIIIIFSVSKNVNTIVKHLNYNLHQLAEGDLTVVTSEELKKRRDEVGELSRSISKLKWNMRKIIGEIGMGANSVAEASQHISISAQAMSQGSNQQAENVEDICTIIEQITASIKQNADNSKATEKISADAQEGIEIVNEKASRSLEATKEITERIHIINDIAFQTNILALNAAVEAARAGEHGKGFAVVAAEVRKLAEKSKQAADQVVGQAKISFDLAEETGQKMAETLPQIIKTTQLVREISASSIEQENGVNQVNTAIQQLNNVSIQNAAASEELATSSEQLSNQADHLRDLISFFQLEQNGHQQDRTESQKRITAHPRHDDFGENAPMTNTGLPVMIKKPEDNGVDVF